MSKKRIVLIAFAFSVFLIFTSVMFWHSFQNEDKHFEAYTHNLFCQELSGNTLSLHYTLQNPEEYGIENAPVSLGNMSTDSDAICASLENTKAQLSSFDQSRLSAENQLTYDVLGDYLDISLENAPYLLYEEPLAPLTGIQSQLPVLLSEYPFYDTDDMDAYLKLLQQTPDYFQSVLDFEKARANAGLFMSADSVDAILEECDSFLQMGESCYLYTTFQERLEQLSLPETATESYETLHHKAMEESVFPAYEALMAGLSSLMDEAIPNGGLCRLPQGKEYYQALVHAETGSSRSVPELKELTVAQMNEDLNAIQSIYTEFPESLSLSSDLFNGQGITFEDSNPSSILVTLENCMEDAFPELPDVNVQVKYVQKSMEEYLSPAFYMIPPIDNSTENVIYINQGRMPDDLTLFTTLAHEGYPGHLYQTVYYQSLNPDPIRSLLNFGGYTEGWATYCEMISYYYSPLSKEMAALMQKNSSLILGLYALADIGIHYTGWSLAETITFFGSYGITDTGTIQDIYQLIVADPANYLKYYIGYVEFLELKKNAIETWGDDFSQKRFHQEVLEIGPASFNTLKHYIGDGEFSKNSPSPM